MNVLPAGLVVAAILVAAGNAQAADGQAVYAQNCGMCHDNLPPKIGDKEAWAPLIKKGSGDLVTATIKGQGAMPARGGHPDLSDADVKAAVDYLVSKSQ